MNIQSHLVVTQRITIIIQICTLMWENLRQTDKCILHLNEKVTLEDNENGNNVRSIGLISPN